MITVLYYIFWITMGGLTKEFIHFNKNQKYYSRGTNTIGEQVNRYIVKRWDNLLITYPMGAIFALIFHNVGNSEAVSAWLANKLGAEDLAISLSSYALTAIFSAFSGWIGVKTGIISKDELYD